MNPSEREAAHTLYVACGRSVRTCGACSYAAPYSTLACGHGDVLQRIGANGVDVFWRYNVAIADEAVEEVGRYNGALRMCRDDNGVSSVEISDPFAICE